MSVGHEARTDKSTHKNRRVRACLDCPVSRNQTIFLDKLWGDCQLHRSVKSRQRTDQHEAREKKRYVARHHRVGGESKHENFDSSVPTQ